jgi:hypothetical protein
MSDAELQQRVLDYFRSEAGRFRLDGGSLIAERVLNWGGFVSRSYRVGDGGRSVHVKLATDQAEIRRWLSVHDRLEADDRAPKVLGWIDLPGTAYGGLVFDHIDGRNLDIVEHQHLLPGLWELLERLHDDAPLAKSLGDGPRSYPRCWELRYREPFDEGLKALKASRPASVPDSRVSWMEQEARVVLALAARDDAFDGVARSPCHWDLWTNNVLVEEDGLWWVLDWDGLAVGDEAEDFATLVWPFVQSPSKDWRELIGWEGDRSFAARMDLHLRAIGLDYLIDVLADWSGCEVPEWRDEVQRQKEFEHHQFYDWYRSRWG